MRDPVPKGKGWGRAVGSVGLCWLSKHEDMSFNTSIPLKRARCCRAPASPALEKLTDESLSAAGQLVQPNWHASGSL